MKKVLSSLKLVIKLVCSDIWKAKIAIICVVLYLQLTKLLMGAMCPMVIVTGLPCPGCGMTRAAVSLLRLRFLDAFAYNSCVYLWLVFGMYLFFYRYIKRSRTKHFVLIFSAVMTITIGVYIYRMIYRFPGEAPMTYMYNNLLARYMPGYKLFLGNFWKL